MMFSQENDLRGDYFSYPRTTFPVHPIDQKSIVRYDTKVAKKDGIIRVTIKKINLIRRCFFIVFIFKSINGCQI